MTRYRTCPCGARCRGRRCRECYSPATRMRQGELWPERLCACGEWLPDEPEFWVGRRCRACWSEDLDRRRRNTEAARRYRERQRTLAA